MKSLRSSPAAAFTLIELLVVITIIAVLAGLLLPVINSVTMKSHETQTLSNLRQMGAAMLAYAGDNNYRLPGRAVAAQDSSTQPDKWPKVLKPYVQDLRVYISPIPPVNGKTYLVDESKVDVTSNVTNYTSYIYNGFNDMGTLSGNLSFVPQLNTFQNPASIILLGIPLPQQSQYYMDFSEGAGNNVQVLNRTAFGTLTPYMFADGSARMLSYSSTTNMRAAPPSGGVYTDWLWLVDKQATSVIQ